MNKMYKIDREERRQIRRANINDLLHFRHFHHAEGALDIRALVRTNERMTYGYELKIYTRASVDVINFQNGEIVVIRKSGRIRTYADNMTRYLRIKKFLTGSPR